MLASLIYGSDKMKISHIENKVGRKQSIKKKTVIECSEPTNIFKIGHSSSTSETFMPNVHFDEVS